MAAKPIFVCVARELEPERRNISEVIVSPAAELGAAEVASQCCYPSAELTATKPPDLRSCARGYKRTPVVVYRVLKPRKWGS